MVNIYVPHHAAYAQLTEPNTSYSPTKPDTSPTKRKKKVQRQSAVLLESFHSFTQASPVLIITAVIRGRQITGNSRHVVEGSLVTVVGR
jgi:hypothetical protein